MAPSGELCGKGKYGVLCSVTTVSLCDPCQSGSEVEHFICPATFTYLYNNEDEDELDLLCTVGSLQSTEIVARQK